jgi:hypothetical protein
MTYGADQATGQMLSCSGLHQQCRNIRQEVRGVVFTAEQPLEAFGELGVITHQVTQIRGTLRLRQIQQVIQVAADQFPVAKATCRHALTQLSTRVETPKWA